ncbi:MAG: 23S rRNA (uracil(1939)-C(5))-methyltransferase RlmD [Candidatus Limiplasma sp.]|nr:23S rRNA (uracil(1939)-C(5))-methyltransferase RlmD [Candidatus Limiplasma sp.]
MQNGTPTAGAPACPYAERCGGCSLLGVAYSDQLAMKQARVAELLKPYVRTEPIRGMENPLHYRNKAHIAFGVDRRGKPIAGVYQAGTHRLVPVEHCLIEDEHATAILATVRKLVTSFGLAHYDEDRRMGFLRHAVVRVADGEAMLTLVTAQTTFPGKNAFLQALLRAHPEITTVMQNLNDRPTTQVLGKRESLLFGKGYLSTTLCGVQLHLSPQAFFQVNTPQTEVLYGLARDMAGLTGRETVLDAYCGIGAIGLSMASGCGRLYGVELNPQAVRDAQNNARRNGVRNALFVCEDAGRWMNARAREGFAVDTVILDPPRSGSDPLFLRALLQLAPSRVVYISCDPYTLARDVASLVKGGYRMRRAVPVDMFPETEHVECATLLTR